MTAHSKGDAAYYDRLITTRDEAERSRDAHPQGSTLWLAEQDRVDLFNNLVTTQQRLMKNKQCAATINAWHGHPMIRANYRFRVLMPLPAEVGTMWASPYQWALDNLNHPWRVYGKADCFEFATNHKTEATAFRIMWG